MNEYSDTAISETLSPSKKKGEMGPSPRSSLEFLAKGSAQAFVDALTEEALTHPAVHHPYLKRLSIGDVPNPVSALRDYAYQYSFYSRHFSEYVRSVIESLPKKEHRDLLHENLAEEQGIPGSTKLADLPHSQIFARFAESIGVTSEYRNNSKPCMTVQVWQNLFLQKCRSPQLGVGIGGIGLGTELIVPTIYQYLLSAIKKFTHLSEEDYFFFTLHAVADEKHAQHLKHIAVELSEDTDIREAIRFGVFSALNLRKAFWDVMMGRALAMKA